MQAGALSEIVDGRIWGSERPVWFGGVRLRARTSVIRLDDGRLLVHSPAPPSDDVETAGRPGRGELAGRSQLFSSSRYTGGGHRLSRREDPWAPRAPPPGIPSFALTWTSTARRLQRRCRSLRYFPSTGSRSWTRPSFTIGPRKRCLERMWSCRPMRTTTGRGASPRASPVASIECASRLMSGRRLSTRRRRHDLCKPSNRCRSRGSSSLTVRSSRKRRWHDCSKLGAWKGWGSGSEIDDDVPGGS